MPETRDLKSGRFLKQDDWARFLRFLLAFDDPGCWRWAGQHDKDGYACFWVDGKPGRAHRYAYEQCVGTIPEGMQIDHLCKTRDCCNPCHLEAVTLRENVDRSENFIALNRAKTHCVRGHEFDYHNGKQRICKTCNRIKASAFYYRKKANVSTQEGA